MRIRRRHAESALLCAATLAALAVPPRGRAEPAAAAPPGGGALRFERDASLRESAQVRAVAVDAARGRIAFGDLRGAWLREDGGSERAVLRRGPVTALAFEPDGALLVGTERGLFEVDTEGRQRELSPPGEAARRVHAVAATGGLRAAATGDGVFLMSVGAAGSGGFERLHGEWPAREAVALALRQDGERAELWAIVDRAPWRATLRRDGGRWRVDSAAREDAAGLGAARADAVDVLIGEDGSTVVASGDAIAWRDALGAWRRAPVTLPPGARIARAGEAAGRSWLATDRGLLEAAGWSGPWRRAAPAAGSAAAHAIAGHGTLLVVGTAEGLVTARPHEAEAAGPVAAPGAGRLSVFEEPDVATVHRVALAYLDLGPARMQRLRDGAARRGFLPLLGLHLSRDVEHGQRRIADESFVSGATRALQERASDRARDYGMALSMEWDLGDAAFHPEEIDVSREVREVIELRDDVLDEVTQLYFERRRVVLELARLTGDAGGGDVLEQARLRLRADELAAGLDAWTGGWFGRHTRRLAP